MQGFKRPGDFKQEEEQMRGKKMGNEASVDNYQHVSPYGFACLNECKLF